MWIFLNDAFLSVVADKDNPTGPKLLVRARRIGHIEQAFPEAEVFQMAGSDYAFRAWIDRKEVARVMAERVNQLDYSNFKNAIEEQAYHDAALEAWFAMRDYQQDHLRN